VNSNKIKSTFSIEEVSEIAGVNSFTLRNWEDRYALFKPDRDAKGHRIFSEADTIRAVVAAELTHRQHKIGKIAADLQVSHDPHFFLRENVEGGAFRALRKDAVDALLQFNSELFQQVFLHVIGNYDVDFVADHFFYPIFREFEELKMMERITSFQFQFSQHHLSARIFRLTGNQRMRSSRDVVGRVLVAGFPENQFEDSTLILQLVFDRYGWEVVYGGRSVVMSELQETILATNVEVMILVGNNLTTKEYDEHEAILKSLSIPVIVGGRLALKLLADGRKSTDQIELSNLRPGPFARLLKYKLAPVSQKLDC
jgi:hypothetical protein